jgi:hypothetical protein
VGDVEETFGSSVSARMASHVGEGPADPVDDLQRIPAPGPPPVPGAQWDELHHRWEIWDDAAQGWLVVGQDDGDGVAPSEENPLTSVLDRELLRGDDLEAEHLGVPDVTRVAAEGPAPRGAQWNEVAGRWERWDEASEAWVEASVEPEAPGA